MVSGPLSATAAAAAAVSCVDVVKVYGSGPSAVHALREVNMDVAFGEFVVVPGPSGSGKTTLLNVIGAIEPPAGRSGEPAPRGERHRPRVVRERSV